MLEFLSVNIAKRKGYERHDRVVFIFNVGFQTRTKAADICSSAFGNGDMP